MGVAIFYDADCCHGGTSGFLVLVWVYGIENQGILFQFGNRVMPSLEITELSHLCTSVVSYLRAAW